MKKEQKSLDLCLTKADPVCMTKRYQINCETADGRILKGGYLFATRLEAEQNAARMSDRSGRYRYFVVEIVTK